MNKYLARSNIYEDAHQLIEIVENNHPAFFLNTVRNDYYNIKKMFLSSIDDYTTEEKLRENIDLLLNTLNDNHTYIKPSSKSRYLEIMFHASNENLFLISNISSITDVQILSIYDIPIANLLNKIDIYKPWENIIGRHRNYSKYAGSEEILKRFNINITDTATLTIKNGKEIKIIEVPYIKTNPNQPIVNYHNWISWNIDKDIFYLKMDVFYMDKSFMNALKALKNAVLSGVTKVIIDLRQNNGGDASIIYYLLDVLEMKPPLNGQYIPMSKFCLEYVAPNLSKLELSFLLKHGYIKYDSDIRCSKANKNINLVLLSDMESTSASTIFLTYVQDGSLGTVIGRPSANSPNCYTLGINFELINSKIKGQVSIAKKVRADINANPNILEPNIYADYSENILDIAYGYLNNL